MRVAIDSRFLLPHLEGFGRFTREVASRLIKLHPEVEFDLLFDRKPLPIYHFGPNQRSIILPPPTRHWILYEVWWRYSMPWYVSRHKPKVLFATYAQVSRKVADRVPTVAFIHDVGFARYPEHIPKDWYRFYMRTTWTVIEKAKLLIVNSFSVKNDLLELFDADTTRIRIVYNGCDGEIFKPLLPEDILSVRQRYTQGVPYILYVGSLHPRKNPVRLLQAYDILRESYTDPLRFILVSRVMFGKREIEEAYNRLRTKQELIFLSSVSDRELAELYGAAAVVVYPSLYEGFGYPVVEAMACGVPVVISRVSSLPEVGGEAAFYVNPYDAEDIAKGIREALVEPLTCRQVRIARGQEHVRQFTWSRCVQQIWEALLEVAH
ncbi:MAG: glycosyltransferase family 1 protein [Bacteroidia bacterium]|nr:glycosyltransferase family 4 protein [Bacteroidia bacterium]MDW8134302.1 glycosyltransferase family 1 protein [Bacteroidia bacterium]